MRRKSRERKDELRKLPQVERLADSMPGQEPHDLKVIAARQAIDQARSSTLAGEDPPEADELLALAGVILNTIARRRLTRVINATGVLLHTNLGRAPLPEAASEAIAKITTGYSNLEFDLETAKRGSRYGHAVESLRNLTGAEDALVVNNNAGAVLLALAGSARGKEVLISRGELIEIGGEFRIPDILRESGARLVEVGTTNRTHLQDYKRALSQDSGLIMKVHPSNYRVIGFASSVPSRDLVDLAHSNGHPFVHDLGSGLLRRRIGGVEPVWLKDEPSVADSLAEGADLVTFSGDKLLAGPQAGIICGTTAAIDKLKNQPLLRALRVDKLTLAALDATLSLYVAGEEATLPFWSMALLEEGEIAARASRIMDELKEQHAKVAVIEGHSTTGGGSSPTSEIPTALLEISPLETSAQALHRSLVAQPLPIVGRIDEDRLLLDLRTVDPSDDDAVASGLKTTL